MQYVALCRLAAVVGLQMLASLSVAAASSAPLKFINRDARSEWIDTRAWGGGAEFIFGTPQIRETGAPSLKFNAGPVFTLGCSSFDPAKSYWRFRVAFTNLGSGATGDEEIAYDEGAPYYLGAPGALILFDEIDKEMKRFPLLPKNGALETERLAREDVRSFLDASAIRAETPRIFFESGTIRLMGARDRMSKLPCAAR